MGRTFHRIATFVFLAALFGACKPNAEHGPVVFGDLDHFSAHEIAELKALAQTNSESVDLIQVSDDIAELYLPAKTVKGPLRRGKIVTARLLDEGPEIRKWQILKKDRQYAQVSANGRLHNDVLSGKDINKPFEIVGPFDDEEVVTLVQLVRSGPMLETPSDGLAKPVPGDRPIRFMVRDESMKDHDAAVYFDATGEWVRFRKGGADWKNPEVFPLSKR